jgi:Uma2 family endonuclease
MASTTLVSVEEYLRTSYEPDCDFVDGRIVERSLGEWNHGRLQLALAIWFERRRGEWDIRVNIEQRVRVSRSRFRIPDVCVIPREQPVEPVLTRPPLICIEILSREDTLGRLQERIDDYLDFGVANVWVLDPEAQGAYVCERGGNREVTDGVLRVAESPIAIPLADLFGGLD